MKTEILKVRCIPREVCVEMIEIKEGDILGRNVGWMGNGKVLYIRGGLFSVLMDSDSEEAPVFVYLVLGDGKIKELYNVNKESTARIIIDALYDD